jgi:membrane associated rhomboid family serine protease
MNTFLEYPVTAAVLLATVASSIYGFSNSTWQQKSIFNPYSVVQRKEYWRVFSHALIHADFIHLFFNMYVFYEFGRIVEGIFTSPEIYYAIFTGSPFWGQITGRLMYLTLYVGAAVFATLPSLRKHRNNPLYNSLGASGAVSAIVIAFIVFFPVAELRFLLLPFIPIPAFVIGIFFFWYESYMSRRGGTGIAHDAHLYGALFGAGFLFLVNPELYVRCITSIAGFVEALL